MTAPHSISSDRDVLRQIAEMSITPDTGASTAMAMRRIAYEATCRTHSENEIDATPEWWIFERNDGAGFFADRDPQHGKMVANAYWGENDWTRKALFSSPTPQIASFELLRVAIADGFTNGNQQYEDCEASVRARFDDAARAVLMLSAPQIAGDVIAAIEPFTRGAFTGWMHKSCDDTITLDEAEAHFSLCMADMMDAARAAALAPQPQPTTPPFSRWADIIEAASRAISPKGSKELDALAAEVRAGGVAQAPLPPKVREALQFYASEWQANGDGDSETPGLSRSWMEPTDELHNDEGRKARQALALPSTTLGGAA